MSRSIAIIVGSVLLVLAGCDVNGSFPGPGETGDDGRVNRLQSEVDTLTAKLEELGADYDTLSSKLTEQKFINEQLNEQLEIVADAPRQRDQYQRLATERLLEIERLKRRIATLEELLGIPASRPATMPTTGEAK